MNIKFLLAVAAPLFVASIFSSCKEDKKKTTDSSVNKENGEKVLLEKKSEAGVRETSSGLLFKINTYNPDGIRPEEGDTVVAVVTGTLFDAKQREFRYDTIRSTMKGQVAALKEAVSMMTEGSDFDFYSPYYLAYGTIAYTGYSRALNSNVTVSPYSAVMYNVKLISVKTEDK